MFSKLFNKPANCDVVVLGSGAAGLTAALLAHDSGASVQIVEKTARVGGTSAVSGAGIWIPNNHLMAEIGGQDSRDEALAYCRALTMERAADELLTTFVDTAPVMLKYLEAHTSLRFSAMSAPDYYPETPGGKLKGRSVEPRLFDATALGAWRDKVRAPSMMTFCMTLEEIYHVYQAFYRPWAVPQDLLVDRMARGLASLGQALVCGLLHAVLQRNIPILLDSRAVELLHDDRRVAGVALRRAVDGETIRIHARKAVVLATAGFEWNKDMQAKFLPGWITHPNSPPFNEGDGLRMAMAVGADLANMSESWNYPSIAIPGETYEGRPLARGIKAERSGPHIIWVNAQGRRFVNEAANYNSVGKSFHEPKTNAPGYRNMPAWAILDKQFRDRYVVGTATPDDPDPDWLIKADTLAGLAAKAGIDAQALEDTVARWNQYVAQGRDPEFQRGDSAFDRYQGDHSAAHPNLGTIAVPPFYAMPVHPGALGTKGGVRTDAHARALDTDGRPIPGLYAAGNVAASITGPSYYGVGATLGPAMTWGYIAGRHAAQRHS
jgi:succinate dehydrogenase/fumarate reductase flavoprotein subunit